MKHKVNMIRYVCFLSFLSFMHMADAQVSERIPRLELIIWDRGKREIVADQMNIRQAEASGFWRIYEQYESTRRSLCNERLHLIEEYASSVASGDPEGKINNIAKQLLRNNVNYRRICKDYYKRMRGATSVHTAARFFQLEHYLQTALELRMDSLAFRQEPELALADQKKKKN